MGRGREIHRCAAQRQPVMTGFAEREKWMEIKFENNKINF